MSALLMTACGGGGAAFPVSQAPVLQLKGAIDRPAAYTTADLFVRVPVTQTVSFLHGSTAQSHTYTGTSVWSLLNGVGLQADATRKNDLLSRYVMATGADGYRVLFTLGELNPDFGNKPAIVAISETVAGTVAPLSEADGPFLITAPGDVKGGRYVSNLVRLDVAASANTVKASAGGVAATFSVSGQVGTPRTFDVTALRAMTATTQTVGTNVYKGVSLWTLLDGLGLTPPAAVKNPTLTMYAVATGSDGYRAAVSLGEIDPGFGNRTALVAYEMNGTPLGAAGAARLIMAGDLKQSRSVSNLVVVEVFTAPAATP